MEILVVAACVYISSLYPGPEGQYIQGSFAWSVRERYFMLSGIFVGTLPVWVALGAFNLFPVSAQPRCAAIVGALVGYLSTPITFGLLLAIGCNHAGACLRSEEHTSELQSLMRISYAVFCLKKKKKTVTQH